MQERKYSKRTGAQPDLDQRLAAYYGPQLREQPLAQSSWLHLRGKLDQRRSSRQWRLPAWRMHRMHRQRSQHTPAYIRDAFARVAYEARIPALLSSLRCRANTRVRVPFVQVSLLTGRSIIVTLPSNVEYAVQPDELDVLLATGLARSFSMYKRPWLFLRLLWTLLLLLSLGMFFAFWFDGRSLIVLPIAIMLCTVAVIGAHVMGRRLMFHTDRLLVQWLGRSRTCQGLHALADRGHSVYRRGWSEPTLAERIARVCGTRAEIEDERLTFVR